MPHNRFLCHQCNREFLSTTTGIGSDNTTIAVTCPFCGGDFVEQVTELTYTREERHQVMIERQRQALAEIEASRRRQAAHVSIDNDNNENNNEDEGPPGRFRGSVALSDGEDERDVMREPAARRHRRTPLTSSGAEEEEDQRQALMLDLMDAVTSGLYPSSSAESAGEGETTQSGGEHSGGITSQNTSGGEDNQDDGESGTALSRGRRRRRSSISRFFRDTVPRLLRNILHPHRHPQEGDEAVADREHPDDEENGQGQARRRTRPQQYVFSFGGPAAGAFGTSATADNQMHWYTVDQNGQISTDDPQAYAA